MTAALSDLNPIVDDPRAFTPDWVTAALRQGGMETHVSEVEHEPIGMGQIGACYRLHLRHEGGGPDTVVAKIAAGTPQQRAKVCRGYHREVGFYRKLPRMTRICSPHCWYAAISDDLLSFTLLLQDALPLTPGNQQRGCDMAQARSALRNLAGLHAPFWNSPMLGEEATWVGSRTDADIALLAGIQAQGIARFILQYEDSLTRKEIDLLHGAVALTDQWLRSDHGQRSLLHGDYRLDNLMFALDHDGPVMAVDWQTLDVGLPARDVAYFISAALPSDRRRLEESELLRTYHEQLITYGVRDYTLEACRTDYRRGMLQAPLIVVIGWSLATGERSQQADQMFVSLAQRMCSALDEHDVLSLLKDRSQVLGVMSSVQ